MASANQLRDSSSGIPRLVPVGRARFPAPPACPLCGSPDTENAFTENRCALRACNVCDLFFVHPYPSCVQQHKRVASGEYSDIELLECARRYEGERLFYDRHFGLIEEECRGAKSLLDVGCGTGHLLERLGQQPDFYRAGIELNAQAAEFARRVSGRKIWEVPFEQFRSNREFDVITMINVLSHIPSFDGMFRSIRAALRPGGKVILRTSEMERSVSRWNQVHWGIPDDLHFLGFRTLDFLCAKYGFEVTRHLRTPYEEELFRKSRWQQMGRSRVRNMVKVAGVRVPFVLPAIQQLYKTALGERLFISFIVLTPLPSREKTLGASPAIS